MSRASVALRPECARAQADGDRAVDPAGDAHDASASMQVARDDRAHRVLDLLRDALGVDREVVRRDLVHRQAAWPDWRFLSTKPTMFSIESRFSGRSSSFVIADAELLLEVADELEHSGGVDEARFDQRAGGGELGGILTEEVIRGQKIPEIALDRR